MSHDNHKSSAQLEREIDARRLQIERKVDELSARLSPGQLLDEALRFTRNGPAADFVGNMGRSVVNNPIPVALLAASMAWLAIKPEGIHAADGRDRATRPNPTPLGAYSGGRDELGEEYPVAAIKGSYMRRMSVHPAEEHEGHNHTSFVDDAGQKFHALTDAAGQRAGHFRDDSGRVFRGFIDETGHRVTDFRDETGNRMQQAAGWASHTWENATDRAARMGRQLRDGAQDFGRQARESGRNVGHMADDAGASVRQGGEQAVKAVDDFVHAQPLVSGAVAFAIGAVVAGLLPHTRQEDQAFGETADAVRERAEREAAGLYDRGRDEAEHLHEKAREVVNDLHDKARDAAVHVHDAAKTEAEKLTRH